MHYAAKTIVTGIVTLIAACATPAHSPERSVAQVLFVCERGNAKSLMAASYFNQMAEERGLRFRGVSRGLAPDSTTAPAAILARLHAEGFDVGEFHPIAVSAADVAASERVIIIGAALPASAKVRGVAFEQWNDVPPAGANYDAARDSLKAHVRKLIEQLSHSM